MKTITLKEYDNASHNERMSYINKLCEVAAKKKRKEELRNFFYEV